MIEMFSYAPQLAATSRMYDMGLEQVKNKI
jgi:hypothetical protein